jgi:hypothetical protein
MRSACTVSKLTYYLAPHSASTELLVVFRGNEGETNLRKLRLMNDLVYDAIGRTSRASGAE